MALSVVLRLLFLIWFRCIIASVSHLAKSEDDPMKQDAQAAHVRKDPKLPADITA